MWSANYPIICNHLLSTFTLDDYFRNLCWFHQRHYDPWVVPIIDNCRFPARIECHGEWEEIQFSHCKFAWSVWQHSKTNTFSKVFSRHKRFSLHRRQTRIWHWAHSLIYKGRLKKHSWHWWALAKRVHSSCVQPRFSRTSVLALMCAGIWRSTSGGGRITASSVSSAGGASICYALCMIRRGGSSANILTLNAAAADNAIRVSNIILTGTSSAAIAANSKGGAVSRAKPNGKANANSRTRASTSLRIGATSINPTSAGCAGAFCAATWAWAWAWLCSLRSCHGSHPHVFHRRAHT